MKRSQSKKEWKGGKEMDEAKKAAQTLGWESDLSGACRVKRKADGAGA